MRLTLSVLYGCALLSWSPFAIADDCNVLIKKAANSTLNRDQEIQSAVKAMAGSKVAQIKLNASLKSFNHPELTSIVQKIENVELANRTRTRDYQTENARLSKLKTNAKAAGDMDEYNRIHELQTKHVITHMERSAEFEKNKVLLLEKAYKHRSSLAPEDIARFDSILKARFEFASSFLDAAKKGKAEASSHKQPQSQQSASDKNIVLLRDLSKKYSPPEFDKVLQRRLDNFKKAGGVIQYEEGRGSFYGIDKATELPVLKISKVAVAEDPHSALTVLSHELDHFQRIERTAKILVNSGASTDINQARKNTYIAYIQSPDALRPLELSAVESQMPVLDHRVKIKRQELAIALRKLRKDPESKELKRKSWEAQDALRKAVEVQADQSNYRDSSDIRYRILDKNLSDKKGLPKKRFSSTTFSSRDIASTHNAVESITKRHFNSPDSRKTNLSIDWAQNRIETVYGNVLLHSNLHPMDHAILQNDLAKLMLRKAAKEKGVSLNPKAMEFAKSDLEFLSQKQSDPAKEKSPALRIDQQHRKAASINANNIIGGTTPTPLKFNQTTRIANEVSSGGTVLSPGEKLPALKANEKYVYVQTDDGRTAIMIQYDQAAPSDAYIGNHPALVKQLETDAKAKGLPAFNIVGAGEIEIRNGFTLEVNNGAGSLKGTKAHLDYSANDLKARGLKFEEQTNVRDLSSNDPAKFHPMRKEALQLRRDNIPPEYRQRLEAVQIKLVKRFPGQNPWDYGPEVFDTLMPKAFEKLGEDDGLDFLATMLAPGDNIDSVLIQNLADKPTFERNLRLFEEITQDIQ